MIRRIASISVALVTLSFVLALSRFGRARVALGPVDVEAIADAITELDVQRAKTLLAGVDSDSAVVSLERARLSLYVGDCDTASATLATLGGMKEAAFLWELSKNCARATAGSIILENAEKGLWIRLQDEADRALVPVLSDVAVRARAAIERDLGVVMPRPLRIDLVRDLFSLSAVTGLPLTAAETTGTVAVARFGRVNLISPRAASYGFPWQDTLAHEITHLAVSRATRDRAPLWLQEGLAKREETRWREPRPFDKVPDPDVTARTALETGQSVGVDKLGSSIAMLPSADLASIAFAEVTSFVGYWVKRNGVPALRALFVDLKGGPDESADEVALRSVSGYGLTDWISMWQGELSKPPSSDKNADKNAEDDDPFEAEKLPQNGRDLSRRGRLGELLMTHGAPKLAVEALRPALAGNPHDAGVRFRLGRALILAERSPEASELFRSSDRLDMPHSGWFAFHGRFLREAGDATKAEAAFDHAVALNAYLEEAACEGQLAAEPAKEPARADRRPLCEATKKLPRD